MRMLRRYNLDKAVSNARLLQHGKNRFVSICKNQVHSAQLFDTIQYGNHTFKQSNRFIGANSVILPKKVG